MTHLQSGNSSKCLSRYVLADCKQIQYLVRNYTTDIGDGRHKDIT